MRSWHAFALGSRPRRFAESRFRRKDGFPAPQHQHHRHHQSPEPNVVGVGEPGGALQRDCRRPVPRRPSGRELAHQEIGLSLCGGASRRRLQPTEDLKMLLLGRFSQSCPGTSCACMERGAQKSGTTTSTVVPVEVFRSDADDGEHGAVQLDSASHGESGERGVVFGGRIRQPLPLVTAL